MKTSSRRMIRAVPAIALLSMTLGGCEQIPEEFFFVNDTSAPVALFFEDPVRGPHGRREIAPRATLRYAQRPVALHGERWFTKIDDEEQFRHVFRYGISLVDSSNHRATLDMTTLRTRMTYEPPRQFTMHIKPDLFEPAR